MPESVRKTSDSKKGFQEELERLRREFDMDRLDVIHENALQGANTASRNGLMLKAIMNHLGLAVAAGPFNERS